ncbi:DUF302 domain-containing protein [Pseudomonas aeruginosa]
MLALRATSLVMACCFASAAGAADGLIAVQSPYSVKETIDRFETAAKSRGINVFLRLDHAQGAKKVGKDLRPTELLVFGNPQGGTPLMECAQTAGIDLPLKAPRPGKSGWPTTIRSISRRATAPTTAAPSRKTCRRRWVA